MAQRKKKKNKSLLISSSTTGNKHIIYCTNAYQAGMFIPEN